MVEKTKNEDKYDEYRILNEVLEYIGKTYSQHYAGNQQIQVIDVWNSLGNVETTSRDTAIKYLSRYGKKNGYNKLDLYKAIHYIVFMLYFHEKNTTT